MFLGVGAAKCFTYTHYVEERLRVPYRYSRDFTGTITDGARQYEDTYKLYVRYNGVQPESTTKFEDFMVHEGLMKKVACGDNFISSVSEPLAYDTIAGKIGEDANYFLAVPLRSSATPASRFTTWWRCRATAMEITKHDIDSKVLGRPILELRGPLDGDFAHVESEYVRTHKPFYVVYKAPIEDIAAIQKLEDHGFRFVETQLRLTFRLRGHFDTSKAPYVFERVTTEDQLRDVLEIAANTFTDDRFLVDPMLPDAAKVSSARYAAYVRNSFARSDEDGVPHGERHDRTDGRVQDPSDREPRRSADAARWRAYRLQEHRVAPINAYHEFNELTRNGVKRFTTPLGAQLPGDQPRGRRLQVPPQANLATCRNYTHDEKDDLRRDRTCRVSMIVPFDRAARPARHAHIRAHHRIVLSQDEGHSQLGPSSCRGCNRSRRRNARSEGRRGHQADIEKFRSSEHVGLNACPRFLRMFSQSTTFNKGSVSALFAKYSPADGGFRNLLYKLPQDFTWRRYENGMWSASADQPLPARRWLHGDAHRCRHSLGPAARRGHGSASSSCSCS